MYVGNNNYNLQNDPRTNTDSPRVRRKHDRSHQTVATESSVTDETAEPRIRSLTMRLGPLPVSTMCNENLNLAE